MRVKRLFDSKDLVLMATFGCLSSLATLTTAFIPAPLPGLYGVIAVPIGTIFILMVKEIVGKIGAATFTQLISGILSTFLPGGPPVKFIIIPTWVIGGIVIDLFFYATRHFQRSRTFYGLVGSTYNIPGDFLLYWAFKAFLSWAWPLPFFLYGFLAIHAVLAGMAAIFMPNIINRIRPIISQ
jgi:hypothetical protein